jgi:hypothetical protein
MRSGPVRNACRSDATSGAWGDIRDAAFRIVGPNPTTFRVGKKIGTGLINPCSDATMEPFVGGLVRTPYQYEATRDRKEKEPHAAKVLDARRC